MVYLIIILIYEKTKIKMVRDTVQLLITEVDGIKRLISQCHVDREFIWVPVNSTIFKHCAGLFEDRYLKQML